MNCENIFCIYWENEKCILDETSLDILGNCKNCIYVDFEDELLDLYRKKGLNKILSYDKT